MELYGALVDAANVEEAALKMKQKTVNYLSCNINRSISSLNVPNLKRMSILFPDPWACGAGNDKNKKRRVVTPEFAQTLAEISSPGTQIYFASDWQELAKDIKTQLMATDCFEIEPAPTMTAKELCAKYSRPEVSGKRFIDKEEDKPVLDADDLWLDHIPFGGVCSERDIVCENQWRAVYRLVLVRK